MQADPIQEWHRLTEHYREMSDGELFNLDADFGDLTETAQQALRQEMWARGLDKLQAAGEAFANADRPWPPPPDSPGSLSTTAGPSLDAPDADLEADLPHEYTWKTLLSECEGSEQAWQLSEVLRRAGIESWIERPMVGILQLLVAADQLDRARSIAASPIPPEIVELSRMEVPEFDPPYCPACGAEDPVLESADPCNRWLCESCGMEWLESPPNPDQETL
jgi:hypothetical protein